MVKFLLLVEAMLAFIVLCSDAVGDESPRPAAQLTVRALGWPVTLWVWFTHRNLTKLARFGAIVWLFLTSGWLLSLEYDRLPGLLPFLAVGWGTLAFVVYCVDAMNAEVQHHPLRRIGRSLLWFRPLTGYLRDTDSIKLIQASVTVWGLLTSGWLLSLLVDRVGRPLGWV